MNSRWPNRFTLATLLCAWTIGLPAQQPPDTDPEIVSEARFGNTKAIQQLLEAGASIEARGRMGGTPLIAAAEMGRSETVKFLLDKGANIEAEDTSGETALNTAANSSNEDTAGPLKLLLDRGAKMKQNTG